MFCPSGQPAQSGRHRDAELWDFHLRTTPEFFPVRDLVDVFLSWPEHHRLTFGGTHKDLFVTTALSSEEVPHHPLVSVTYLGKGRFWTCTYRFQQELPCDSAPALLVETGMVFRELCRHLLEANTPVHASSP